MIDRRSFLGLAMIVPAVYVTGRVVKPKKKGCVTDIYHRDEWIGRVDLGHYVDHSKDEMHL
ncbi:unnamed protein product [marine sediment metagenome]|uniref:Uncharacterized protein n=1 Tax=marine sediment metagenome TaxID=412755 RepID=X0V2P7_9ZZZZ